MKTRRKIWSMPIAAFALALMLASVLIATGIVQAVNPGTDIPKQTLTIGESASTIDVDLEDVDGNGNDAFADTEPPTELTYTALTGDPSIATVSLTDSTTVANAWWAALDGTENTDCSKKATRLGFTVGVTTADNTDANNAESSDGTVSQSGLCLDSPAGNLIADDPNTTQDETLSMADAVALAFHWDMLSGAEMKEAARAAGDGSPDNYAHPFGVLGVAEKRAVQSWFANGTLARGGSTGSATLTLGARASGADPAPEAGTTTITVKASDATGRLIPPGDGSETVGQTFDVEAVLTPAPPITPFTFTIADGVLDTSGSRLTPGSGNAIDVADGDDVDTEPDHYTVRISPDSKMIATVNVVFSPDHGDHMNPINFSLTNGDNVEFDVQKVNNTTATILPKPGVTLTAADSPYKFTLVVNERNRPAQNIEKIDVQVTVVMDNEAPEFPDTNPTSGEVEERAMGAIIATFAATDANNQVLTYDLGLKDDASDATKALFDSLMLEEANGGVVLKTTSANEATRGNPSATPPVPATVDQPDYNEEDPNANTHVIVIKVTDDPLSNLYTEHDFELTVTNIDDPEPGARQRLDMPEDQAVGMGNIVGEAPSLEEGSTYRIDQQIDNHGNIANREENPDDILFSIIADTGKIYLDEDALDKSTPDNPTDTIIDFEGGTLTYTLAVSQGATSGFVVITVTDVNEEPTFSGADKAREDDPNPTRLNAAAEGKIEVVAEETAAVGTILSIGADASGNNPSAHPAQFVASDEDSAARGNAIAYDLWWQGEDGTGGYDVEYTGPDAIVEADSDGYIRVKKELEADGLEEDGALTGLSLVFRAYEPGNESNNDTLDIFVTVIDRNVGPEFDAASIAQTHAEISEAQGVGYSIFTYTAIDADGDPVLYRLRDEDDTSIFTIDSASGVLTLASQLDYETAQSHTVEVQAYDSDGDTDEVVLVVDVIDVNDTPPALEGPSSRTVSETTKPGTVIGSYTLTDVDTVGKLEVTVASASDPGYAIEQDTDDENKWNLKTTIWLDADTNTSDSVTLIGSDGMAAHNQNLTVAIDILDTDDSISNIYRTMANPLPGGRMGDADAALDDSPANYVSTEWASWGTVLRIRVTNPSSDSACGYDCVLVSLESDSADTSRMLKARRTLTQEKGNEYFAAVKFVEEYATGQDADAGAGAMSYLKVDEEDEVTIKFVNARKSVEIENEAPEIDNFSPAHETAFKDEDVDYTFTVTDDNSGIPDAEDLPDTDGDSDYTSVVALISRSQCSDANGGATGAIATLHNGRQIMCSGNEGIIDEGGDYEFRQIVDDKDFSDIDSGVEVETTIAFAEENDRHYWVTFIACDAAGNCIGFDPDENDDDVALPRITVDTTAPKLEEARTGVAWNATDNEYDDDRSFVQVVFSDLTPLNPDTVEIDDFLVAGHVIKAVHLFDPDDEDTPWGDENDDGTPNTSTSPSRFASKALYQHIDRTVFLELEEDLAPDEKPKVSILPNGVEDAAANEQDDADVDADDWIAPAFTVVSIVSPLETSQSEVLAGEEDRVVFTLTADERLYSPRPTVTVTYVNAPKGCVETESGQDHARGEIITGGYCGAGAGSNLASNIEKVSNTEWTITAKKPNATGYYSFHVEGQDRSAQRNRGSEGIAKDDIKTDFFEKNGDVSDDAHFFQGDINLSKPRVRVSGMAAGDDDPVVELRSPLFVELDFTVPHSDDCGNPADARDDCIAESDEYAKDSYNSVTVTSFMLDGVDITDSVKTTDDETFLVAIDDIAAGDHEINIQAVDAAGNSLDDTLDIEFEVEERDPFEKRLSPGWNLVSLPGEPADGSISAVFGPNVEVRTVYTYDPVVPGGWMVAVRETLDSDWQGDLTDISGQRGYWVLSDAIQDWEVSVPRLAGGAAGTGTPIQPPSIALYAGWNLIPVTDVTGDFAGGIRVAAYLEDLGTSREIELARVLSFNTIRNEWRTLNSSDTLDLGSGYWVFVRAPATLVPGN